MTQIASSDYGFGCRLAGVGLDEAIASVTEELKSEGFGVLTTIDVQATLKQKLDVDFRPYVILGACNPQLAHRALGAETEIGLLLPCNVVVYQEGDDCVVSVADPDTMLEVAGNPELGPLGAEAKERLSRVVERLASA